MSFLTYEFMFFSPTTILSLKAVKLCYMLTYRLNSEFLQMLMLGYILIYNAATYTIVAKSHEHTRAYHRFRCTC